MTTQTPDPILEIENLHANVAGHEILKGLDLSIGRGEVHAIMGPNGAGKSTLAHVLAGRDGYEVTAGRVRFAGQELLELPPHERAAAGLFLGFQYPVEIPGVSNLLFLRTAMNAQRGMRGEPGISGADFMKRVRQEAAKLGLDLDMLRRGVNVGFSGGEKKRNEAFQLAMLEPKLALLDETDSGLDIDALRVVSDSINRFRRDDRAVLLITHYQRLLDHVRPDVVHVLVSGRIVESGDADLALRLEEKGYEGIAA